MYDLSILIPARNEMFLAKTVWDILEHRRDNTEVIVALDGEFADPAVPEDPRVTVLYIPQSIGQRAATNAACRLSTARYVMKCDAHCSFDEGFDSVMLGDMQENWTMVPIMRNLHAFDWVCRACGWRNYQGPTPERCPKCGGGDVYRDVVWIGKPNPQSTSYCFDSEPHFQYFNDFKKRKEGQGDITETMSLQGSCFMMSRERYWALNVCDESFGSWGSQGIEVACKTWFSGGRVVCNHKTWYAHMFRTQGGDFGFPYPLSGRQVASAKNKAKEMFLDSKWPSQVDGRDLNWLLRRFWPVPGWDSIPGGEISVKDVSKQIIYYTDNRLDQDIMSSCQSQLTKSGLDIISVSLEPIDFGTNIALNLVRGYLTMFKQILAGLEFSTADVIFFAEHDVLYHPSHFEFVPWNEKTFYYNTNVWKVDWYTGKCLHYDCQQTSGLCAFRELLLEHYRKRVKIVEEIGFSRRMGFEPGTHNRPEKVDDYKAESWKSPKPNIDVRHRNNLTPSRWKKEEFRNQRFTSGWIESDEVPGWEKKDYLPVAPEVR